MSGRTKNTVDPGIRTGSNEGKDYGPFPEYRFTICEYFQRRQGKDVDLSTLTRQKVESSGFFQSEEFKKDVMSGTPGLNRGLEPGRLRPVNAQGKPVDANMDENSNSGGALSSASMEEQSQNADPSGQRKSQGTSFPLVLASPAPARHTVEDPYNARLSPMPAPPDTIPDFMPLTRVQELAIKNGFADRKTIPRYHRVASGAALNAGHYNGVEIKDLKANEEILVYVKNTNLLWVPLEIKAGPSFHKNKTHVTYLTPLQDKIFRFTTYKDLIQYFSINSISDSYMVSYQIFSKGHYANNKPVLLPSHGFSSNGVRR